VWYYNIRERETPQKKENKKMTVEQAKAMMKATYEKVAKVVAELTDEQYDKMYSAYEEWVFEGKSKSRLDYWLKKVGLTYEEWEVWVSW
jgi:hypothetical protein